MLTVVLLTILLVGLLLTWTNKKPNGLPPGEWGWPIIGALKPSNMSIGDYINHLRDKHGKIFIWRMGSRSMVHLCDYPLIKKAFNNPHLQDRPDFFTFDCFSGFKKCGLANSNGRVWHNSRRFALRQMRDLGLGKSTLVDAIMYEADMLVKEFHTNVGRPILIPYSVNTAVLNIIWKLTSDARYETDDPEIQKLEKVISESFEETQGYNMIFDFFPWVIPITPEFIRRKLGITSLINKCNEVRDFILKVIDEHEAALDPTNPRDYIDLYLIEMAAQKNDPDSTMNRHDLWVQVMDLFTAGTETSSATIRWCLLYLAKYPEIQSKVQRDIDEAVPRDRLPSMDDKDKLHYLEAVISEVSRVISVVPQGVMHFAAEDTELAGFKIPKDTVIVPNQEMCHFDPDYWEKPNEFYPEHFLDANGKALTRKESFLPFSVGRRLCPGENLARLEIFIFLAALLQNFVFSAPEGKEIDLEKDPAKPLFVTPKPVNVLITKRK